MAQYGTFAGYVAYWLARGVAITADEVTVNAKLLLASVWLDGRYGDQFCGIKVGGRAQERLWPRSGVMDAEGYAVPSDVVPVEIENATYEAARQEELTGGSLVVIAAPSKYKSVSVAGAMSVTYADKSANEMQTQFLSVDYALRSLLRSSGISSLVGDVSRA